ncbi:MAG: MraY family glycosyltransferase [Anaerolineales bacterium]|jgi:UDP-GlcNAc:undecaprenyl-phosphate GlcNAc-1-phosphate transferase
MQKLTDLFPYILIASLVSFVFTPLAVRTARRLKLLDYPGSAPHKIHQSAVPLGGGIVIAVTVLFVGFASKAASSSVWLSILIGSTVIFIWGMLDDRYGLKPSLKLVGQLIAVAILMGLNIRVSITNSIWIDGAITVVWLVGMTNAFNFVDSMDGLALGLAGIAAAFFMLVTIDSGQPNLAKLSATVLGASIGLFFYNAAPARVFLGDSGAQFLGFLLAAIGLAYNPVGLPQEVSWFTPVLVLGVPIFDTVLVSFSRLVKGKPVYIAGRDHSYHRLVKLGLDSTRAVLLMQLCGIGLGLLSFILLGTNALVANAVFAAVVLTGIITVFLLSRQPLENLDELED